MKSGGDNDTAPPEFLSTHPSHDSRITNFDNLIPQAMTIFQADYGERCHDVRQKMSAARRAAAQQAAFREQRQQK